jgi:hypothetical protein
MALTKSRWVRWVALAILPFYIVALVVLYFTEEWRHKRRRHTPRIP